MEPNPYEAPREAGYQQSVRPDGETFAVSRLFVPLFVMIVIVLLFTSLLVMVSEP